MTHPLQGLEPQAVLSQFEAISQIPRCSHNVGAVADYCEEFARSQGLICLRDTADNLIITIPASADYEKAAPVIIQGHLDMVCEKTPGAAHDFAKDPLDLAVSGDDIFARNTSLGGDDGIAVAMGLALMADPALAHPKVYCLFTADEEVGMDGAAALNVTPMADATRMINLDSEQEGTLLAGCAGGASVLCAFPLRYTKAKGLQATVSISGLTGGHSGGAIADFGANANVLLGKLLFQLGKTVDLSVISLEGGGKDNVIPRSASAQILIGPNERDIVSARIQSLNADFRQIFKLTDPDMQIAIRFGDIRQYDVLGRDSEELTLFVLMNCPNGVIGMHRQIRGQVDTSLNLGILKIEDNSLTLSFSVRGNQALGRDLLCDRLCAFAAHLGGTTSVSGVYPPWEYAEDSPLRTLMIEVYTAIYGVQPTVTTIHAGLECGIIADKLAGLDIVSMGPDIVDIHTPQERMRISSVARTWHYLLTVLAAMKD